MLHPLCTERETGHTATAGHHNTSHRGYVVVCIHSSDPMKNTERVRMHTDLSKLNKFVFTSPDDVVVDNIEQGAKYFSY